MCSARAKTRLPVWKPTLRNAGMIDDEASGRDGRRTCTWGGSLSLTLRTFYYLRLQFSRHSTSTRKPPVPEPSPTTHPTVGRPTPAKTAEHAGESAPATGPRRGRSRLLTWQTGCDGVCALRAASSHLEGPSWPSSTRQSPAIALTRRRAPLPRRQAALVQETGP